MKKRRYAGVIACIIVTLALVFTAACSQGESGPETEPLDYGEAENWAYFALGEDKDVDVFLICPVVDIESETNAFDMDETFKADFVNALDMERGLYEETGRLFSPYYRQMSINAYTLPEEERLQARDFAYEDISAAFRWYLDNENEGRGLILAGFSQGSEMCLELMKEYFGGDSAEAEALRSRLIAVYSIGWPVTEDMVKSDPQIVPAQGETDTGVVVSFECEDGTLTDTIIIPEGVTALSINPLNWKTDGTPADRSLNLGAVLATGAEPIPGLCGAYIGERGELVVTDVSPADYPPVLDVFPEGSYHVYDYLFFFTNLKNNVAARTAAWRSAQSGDRGEYVVREGDSLHSIAEAHGITTAELALLNRDTIIQTANEQGYEFEDIRMYAEYVFPGQILRLPDPADRGDLQAIRERGYLLVGATGDYQPMSWLDPETGAYTGFDAELAEDLAESLDVYLIYVPTSWPTLMEDTLGGKFDLAVCGITVTEAREEQALMSEGYFENGKTILVRAEDAEKYTDLASIDRPEVRVMVNPGGLNEQFARDNLPNATLIVHDANQEIPALIAQGEADVMITEIMEGGYYVGQDSRLAAPLIYEPFTHGQLGVLMPKGSEALLDYVNAFLAREKDSGRIDELAETYIYQYIEPRLDEAA